MTTGYSGSYAINATNFLLSPTRGGWKNKDVLGIDGNGHPIYPPVREFEIFWGLAHPNDVKQLNDFYLLSSSTGTLVFDLPQWGASDYIFARYSGCTMTEPQVGEYFNGYIEDVKVTVLLVRA